MKKFFLAILLVIPFGMNAQLYHPLVDSGAVWNVEEGRCDMAAMGCNSGFCNFTCWYAGERFFLHGDTSFIYYDSVYNSHIGQYKIVWHQDLYGGCSCDAYISSGNYNHAPQKVGAIRDDTAEKQVWFRWFGGDPYLLGACAYFSPAYYYFNDFLLYDFSHNLGDTLYELSGMDKVVEIDSIQLLNGEWRKRLRLMNGHDWVEEIGSSGGLFEPFNAHFECGAMTTCFRRDNELLYENFSRPMLSCDSLLLTVQSPNFQFPLLQVSPNPAENFLTINFSSPNFSSAQIKITDVLGRNLFTQEIQSNQPLQIATEKFSGSKVIFCELWQEGKLIGVKKVLIQK